VRALGSRRLSAQPVDAATRRRVRAIRDRLRETYGIPQAPPHGDPVAELILTVLSQSTNDRNRDVAYLALRERFPTWEAVRDAPVDAIEEAIRPGGISKIKSARIKAILQAITDNPGPVAPSGTDARTRADARAGADARTRADARAGGGGMPATPAEGSLSIDWLASVSVPEAQAYLCALPGVGRKTAACVLLFSFGMRDVPVDTHVSRVGTRLGLFRERAPFEELHDRMLALTPRGQELELHLNLLRHGRRICHARSPQCGICPLRRMCPRIGVTGAAAGPDAAR
jgi:endonuclease-3